jgi:hypothetical protein
VAVRVGDSAGARFEFVVWQALKTGLVWLASVFVGRGIVVCVAAWVLLALDVAACVGVAMTWRWSLAWRLVTVSKQRD